MPDTNRTIATVLSDIVDDIRQIIRAEVRLAKVEVREELGKTQRAVAFVATAGLIGMIALALLFLAAVYALSLVWPPWAAALAVSVVASALGAILFLSGVRQFKEIHVVPPKTVATLQENVQWAKTHDR
jgi:uncharacterized membrane protein YqjE